MDEVTGRAETTAEKELREWFEKQELASVDNLEGAAKLIITLVTTLQGLLLGVLAVAEDPLPDYFNYPLVRYLGAGSVALLLLALVAALAVVLPFRSGAFHSRPDKQRAAFEQLLRRKSVSLTAAVVAFALGVVALGMVLIAVLLVAG